MQVVIMDINIIGMPIFYGCDIKGVENGPSELRKCNLLGILSKNHKVYDCGDIQISNKHIKKYTQQLNMKYLNEVIEANNLLAALVYKSINDKKLPLIIGGDHSLSLGSIAGASKYYGNDLAIIWIDAHADLNTEQTTPSGNIHGMPLAASIGIGHEKLKSIYFKGVKVKPENIFILGCRDLDNGEVNLIKKLNIYTRSTVQIIEDGVNETLNKLFHTINKRSLHNIHLSFDIDCLDAHYVPGTGTPVKEGFNIKTSKELINGILCSSLVKSIDFVEFNPNLDKNNTTKHNCIEILKSLSNSLR
jgi:arginase